MSLTIAEKRELLALEEERSRRKSRRQLLAYMPYPKQLDFHADGKLNAERLFMAGNQQGKSRSAAAEVAMHLTGRYPVAGQHFYPTKAELIALLNGEDDGKDADHLQGFLENFERLSLFGKDIYPQGWPGHRFNEPISAWVGGKSSRDTRDIVQSALLGEADQPAKIGTGMIPHEDIDLNSITRIPGVPNAFDTCLVRHQSGGMSSLGFKSFDQGRERWQGTKKDLIWLDEESPLDVYMEALTRTNAASGIMLMTFTPLRGLSEVVRLFIHDERDLEKA